MLWLATNSHSVPISSTIDQWKGQVASSTQATGQVQSLNGTFLHSQSPIRVVLSPFWPPEGYPKPCCDPGINR
jgi:hypothetical protein